MSFKEKNGETIHYMSWANRRFIRQPSSRILFALVSGLGSLFLIVLFIAAQFEIELSIESQGQVGFESDLIEVRSPVSGRVKNIEIKSGKVFSVGEKIMSIESEGQIIESVSSKIDGKIVGSQSYEGQTVKKDQRLLTMMHVHDEILVYELVSDMDVSKIEVGAKTYTTIQAFPKSTYGYFVGQVIGIDPRPLRGDRAPSSSKYRITIRLNKQSLVSLQDKALLPGMRTESKIVWKKGATTRVAFDYIFK